MVMGFSCKVPFSFDVNQMRAALCNVLIQPNSTPFITFIAFLLEELNYSLSRTYSDGGEKREEIAKNTCVRARQTKRATNALGVSRVSKTGRRARVEFALL